MPILYAGGMVCSIAPFIMSTRLLTGQTLRATLHHHSAAVLRGVRHTAVMDLLAGRLVRLDLEVLQRRSQHDVHLGVGECGADAPPGAPTERQPRKRWRLGAHETVWV